MHYQWLNKTDKKLSVQYTKNKKLIIFFAGWSFDYKPFEFLSCDDFDVLMLYDYTDIILPEEIKKEIFDYNESYLIAWSMGVYTAYSLRDELPAFKQKTAVNGTPYPVHDDLGIPQKPFLLTLRHVKSGLEGKFYQNIFDLKNELDIYKKTPVERTIENRVGELKALYERIKADKTLYTNFYDSVIISCNDKIIPAKNQLAFWLSKIPVKTLESGHFPFYNFKSWKEIIQCR